MYYSFTSLYTRAPYLMSISPAANTGHAHPLLKPSTLLPNLANMKKINQARSIEDALNLFRQALPDPVRSNESTIINRFIVSDKEIVLNAQKAKGSAGMCWKIAHKS